MEGKEVGGGPDHPPPPLDVGRGSESPSPPSSAGSKNCEIISFGGKEFPPTTPVQKKGGGAEEQRNTTGTPKYNL